MKILLPTPACFGRVGLFVPDPEDRDTDPLGRDIAVAMCAACPYRVECATQGLRYEDADSIRAGVEMWGDYATFRLIDIIQTETP